MNCSFKRPSGSEAGENQEKKDLPRVLDRTEENRPNSFETNDFGPFSDRDPCLGCEGDCTDG